MVHELSLQHSLLAALCFIEDVMRYFLLSFFVSLCLSLCLLVCLCLPASLSFIPGQGDRSPPQSPLQ